MEQSFGRKSIHMKVITDEKQYTGSGAVLALGMFDGVHLGHRALIARAQELARAERADAMVCTFDVHPLSVLAPEKAPAPLTDVEGRLALFRRLGVDWALVKPFTPDLARQEPEDFLKRLTGCTHARGVVCGENYTFGRGGRGNAALLRRLGTEWGFQVEIVQSVTDAGEVVSSTLIRSLLKKGETERALRLLGRTEEG